ncbi:hypothetical protein Taro_020226, partial [Colocasia esculenta]|nr:hypothetical protein [Colocasia esculenta]
MDPWPDLPSLNSAFGKGYMDGNHLHSISSKFIDGCATSPDMDTVTKNLVTELCDANGVTQNRELSFKDSRSLPASGLMQLDTEPDMFIWLKSQFFFLLYDFLHRRGSSSAIHCLGRADVSYGSQVLVVQYRIVSCLMHGMCISSSLLHLFGYTILFNILFTIFLTYLNPLGKEHAVMSKAELQERQDKKKRGDDLELGPTFHSGVNEKERGMALTFQPLIMCFSNINYYVVVPVELKKQGILEDRLQLLVNVTGAFRPGILTALVGVSGAGKTTLMDVLAGRKTGGKRGALLFLVILKIKQLLPESLVI